MQMILDSASRVTSATLINPVSPFGFGGTAGVDGALVWPDGAGSGAGGVTPAFVKALDDNDFQGLEPTSPRSVLRAVYVAPGWDRVNEDVYVTSMLSTSIGLDNYPGDFRQSPNWPGTAPGQRGVLNAMSPVHLDLSGIVDVSPRPPILWIRGELDQIVSDASLSDLAQLGSLGFLPGYPGVDVLPPQPMVGQTRSVLDAYASAGGHYREIVVPGVGHSPHIEDPETVVAALRAHLDV